MFLTYVWVKMCETMFEMLKKLFKIGYQRDPQYAWLWCVDLFIGLINLVHKLIGPVILVFMISLLSSALVARE